MAGTWSRESLWWGLCALALFAGTAFPSTCGEGLAAPREYVSFENEPAAYRRSFVGPAERQTAGQALRVLPVEKRAEAAFWIYLEYRIAHLTGEHQTEVRRIIATTHAFFHESVPGVQGGYSSAPGTPAQIRLRSNPLLEGTALFYAAWAHEVEHAIQYLDPSLSELGISPDPERRKYWNLYVREYGSVRAEFEYHLLVDEETRQVARSQAAQLVDRDDYGRGRQLGLLNAVPSGLAAYRDKHIYCSFHDTFWAYKRADDLW